MTLSQSLTASETQNSGGAYSRTP